MRVTLLGTGASAGVPLIGGPDGRGDWGTCDPAERRNRRMRTSILIERDDRRLLVDTAPDLREQLLVNGIRDVEAVLFTHAHADHIAGLDETRILNRVIDRPLDAYADAATLDELKRRFDYAFRPWQPPGFFRPVLTPRTVRPGQTLDVAGLSVRLFDQDHGFIRSLGLRVGGFGYSTDVVALDDAAFDALRGVDTWVVGCFQRGPAHTTHAHLPLALDWAARVGARRTVLTHMGPDMDWAWLRENLPAGVEAGCDGMVIQVAD